jgi:hypothetical protein
LVRGAFTCSEQSVSIRVNPRFPPAEHQRPGAYSSRNSIRTPRFASSAT